MYNDIRKNENKGFSLVELIVVIAIMAVLTAVLVPSLLSYVERSRAQKDDSAMGEVANAIQLAMADQNIYDEVLYYTCYGNVSCYVDKAEGSLTASKIVTKADLDGADTGKKEQYMFDDDARLADEVEYKVGGNMRGVTITFIPEKNSNASLYKVSNAVVNKFVGSGHSTSLKQTDGTTAASLGFTTGKADGRNADDVGYINKTPAYNGKGFLGDMASGTSANTYLYNRVRATVGDTITLSSQTYRNSEYTVFIRMGSTGGNQATAQDAIAVYGQWNGTNLVASAD
jgi:prepilin-type N-terminal cleavage/methylation domain-containing protein